jgi:Protein of unknown function (DUF2442)
MLKDIIEARATGDHRLYIRFEDGVDGEIDLDGLIDFSGVFELLSRPEELAKVMVDPEIGTICWPNGADLDPDVLYAELTRRPIRLRESARVAK